MSETVKRCETCRYDLGGGYDNCAINLEDECAAGGFEAWEGKNALPDRDMVMKGLEVCADMNCAGTDCPYFPYFMCKKRLHLDALALLRAGVRGEAEP